MNCSLPVKLTYDGKYVILDLRPLLNGKASQKLKKGVNVQWKDTKKRADSMRIHRRSEYGKYQLIMKNATGFLNNYHIDDITCRLVWSFALPFTSSFLYLASCNWIEPLKSWHNNHYNHNNHMLKSVRLRCQSWLWAGHRSCKYAFCQYENIHMMKIYRFVWRYDATRYCQLWECQIIQIWLKVGKKKMHIQKVTRRSRSKGIGQ